MTTGLSYETVEKLRDAGFPFRKWDGPQRLTNSDLFQPIEGSEWYFIPTLSELIEECGEGFKELVREEEDGTFGCRDDYMDTEYLTYPTPEKAVAALYLALHEKNA